MTDRDLKPLYERLGVEPGVTLADLERAYMRQNYALIRGKSSPAFGVNPALDQERETLRAAFDQLADAIRNRTEDAVASGNRRRPQLVSTAGPRPISRPPATNPNFPAPRPYQKTGKTIPPHSLMSSRRWQQEEFAPLAFDNWKVNVLVPPLLLGLAWLLQLTPLRFLLTGFHVWMHEFGHATAAWLCGRRATPLPFGWTPVEPELSKGVYFGVLFLLVVFFIVGLRERKVWPMLAALVLAALQYHMTWRIPEARQEFWWGAFGGVGGEFYLSTLFMLSFWVQMPDKFKWGACRYVFFLIGATAFLNIWFRWIEVHRGLEEIPFGSMINGEDDKGGDMNKLMDAYGWKKVDIRNTYFQLGIGCWIALGVMWLLFALRLNRVADAVWVKLFGDAVKDTPAI